MEISTPEVRLAEVRPCQVGCDELRPAQISITQPGRGQVRFPEISSTEVSTAEIRPPEIRSTQIWLHEVWFYLRVLRAPFIPSESALSNDFQMVLVRHVDLLTKPWKQLPFQFKTY